MSSVSRFALAPTADERYAAILAVLRDERPAAVTDGLAAMPDVDPAAATETSRHFDPSGRRAIFIAFSQRFIAFPQRFRLLSVQREISHSSLRKEHEDLATRVGCHGWIVGQPYRVGCLT